MSRGRVFPTPHPRLATAAAALAAGLGLLAVAPRVGQLEEADRGLFARLVGKEPVEVAGSGSHEDPRRIDALGVPADASPAGVLEVDDDPDGLFEAMPPPPADLAVLLARLRKGGASRFGMAFTPDWEAPDPTALHAFRSQLDQFDSAVLGLPLAFAGSTQPVAVPFLRRSIPYHRVRGDAARLPVVNSIPLTTPEFGGDASEAGFTRLVNEPAEAGTIPLLARWDDRIVFALPLALEIARAGLDEDQVEVLVGEEIRLGRDGARIPIDERGRFAIPAGLPEPASAPATEIFGGELPVGLVHSDHPVYLRDQRADLAAADRAWLDQLPDLDLGLRLAPRVTGSRGFPRPDPRVELIALVALALVAPILVAGGRVRRAFLGGGAVVAATVALLHWTIHQPGLAPMPLAFVATAGITWIAAVLLRPAPTTHAAATGSGASASKRGQPAEGKAAKPARKRPPRKAGSRKSRKRRR